MISQLAASLGFLLLVVELGAAASSDCASDECSSALDEGLEESALVQHMFHRQKSEDVAFVNATVYTSNPNMPTASTVVVAGKKIAYVGDRAGAAAKGLLNGQVHEMSGKVLLPGFVESHVHMFHGTLMQSGVIIETNDKIPDILRKVKDYAEKYPASLRPSIFGSAYFAPLFPDPISGSQTPNKTLLDSVVSDRPVLLNDHTGHSCWGNSKFFELAGITPETFDTWDVTIGGTIHRDENHEPTGFLAGGPTWIPRLERMNVFSAETFTRSLPTTLNALSRHGFTAAFDAGEGMLADEGYGTIKGMDEEGKLMLHGRLSKMVNSLTNISTALDTLNELGRRFNSEHLRFVGYKIAMDSVMENQQAAVLEPYVNQDAQHPLGSLYFTPSQIDTLVQDSARAGYEINIHCIGDRANRQALNAAERLRQSGDNKTIFTIHHTQMVQPVDRPRFAQLNVKVQTTANWAGGVQDKYPEWIGQERTDTLMFPFRFWEEHGVDVALGADWPATPGGMEFGVNPFWNLYTAATRMAPPGTWGKNRLTGNEILATSPGVFPPAHETMSLEKSFEAYTMGGARMLNMQDQIGSIEEGKSADLIMVDQDFFNIPLEDVPRTRVLVTMFEGKVATCELEGCKLEDPAEDKEAKAALLFSGRAPAELSDEFGGFHMSAVSEPLGEVGS